MKNNLQKKTKSRGNTYWLLAPFILKLPKGKEFILPHLYTLQRYK